MIHKLEYNGGDIFNVLKKVTCLPWLYATGGEVTLVWLCAQWWQQKVLL